MKRHSKIKLELLAPARNASIAIEAIKHGADAVYMGAARYGARASAGNSHDDIKTAVEFAHQYNAKIYVTVNTILFENELAEVQAMIWDLYRIGVDALIVQDMAILRMDLPPIALHASTQCDLRTPEKAEFLEKVGFSQLVMARELTLDEIKSIHDRVDVPLEAFVHGALCVSYSGRCGMSYACMQRSANRGECAQMCRLPYNLEDENGNILVANKHLLSLKDLNQSDNLHAMIEAGVSSFKIEGRLKDVDYVKNIVAYYRAKLDTIIEKHSDKYERSSCGTSHLTFTPNPNKVFNRTFTSYFLTDRKPKGGNMASLGTPKSVGEYIGKVIACAKGNTLKISTAQQLANGDGISYFAENGEYKGFRVNKVVGDLIVSAQLINIPKGTRLYRTFDKNFNDVLDRESAVRTVAVDMTLRVNGTVLSLDVNDERDNQITTSVELPAMLELAKTPQDARQKDTLSKLGGTIYEAGNINALGEQFIPNSILANLRRQAVEMLDRAQKINYKYDYRRPEDKNIAYFSETLTYVDNVANSLSRKFYQEHGVKEITEAIESERYKFTGEEVLMHTRYCILRELGYCRKDRNAKRLSQKLYLVNDRVRMLIHTDCAHCEIHLLKQ